jgi:site-specific recombinase
VPLGAASHDITRVMITTELSPIAGAEELLEELARRPDEISGELLGRLVQILRPSRRQAPEVGVERFRALVELLKLRPALATALAVHLRAVLLSRMHRTLYAESGVLTSQGFLTGLWSRLLGSLLPPAVDPDFLRDLVTEVFDDPRDEEWVGAIPMELWTALFARLGVYDADYDDVREHCRGELFEAMRMTSHRLAALGMDPAILRYLPALARHESPFLAQSDEVRTFLAAHKGVESPPPHDGHLEVLLGHCTEVLVQIRKQSQETGVGVNLVFVLARIEQLIERLRLLRLLVAPDPREPLAHTRVRAVEFLVRLVGAESRRHRVRDLFEGTTQLLARRVTEHASKSGEHYVTETRAEYREMFRAAAGAGLLVGAMALMKILSSKLGLPLVWEAVAYSLIYGLGFVLVHILHLTIATKQPAMTAATLAAALDRTKDREARLDLLAQLSAQVSRTQWVSIAGNVLIGFLTALFLALVGRELLGWQPVDTEKAAKLLHELDPVRSLALFHAAIAGVYLFLSGLISGYYDNQSLYHRIPERIRRVKWLQKVLGPTRVATIAAYVEHNLGALAGNFIFGAMLGSTGVIGRLFGLPIDIRHVSFASANLAYGLQALEFRVGWVTVAVSIAGVALIGLVNLVVSFRLALKVALRSRGITPEDTDGLTARVIQHFRRAPLEFFLPPRR